MILTLLLWSLPARAADPPLHVTTNTEIYCQALLQRIATVPVSANGASARLADEGRHLCSIGLHRTGIAKLRRALRMALAETH